MPQEMRPWILLTGRDNIVPIAEYTIPSKRVLKRPPGKTIIPRLKHIGNLKIFGLHPLGYHTVQSLELTANMDMGVSAIPAFFRHPDPSHYFFDMLNSLDPLCRDEEQQAVRKKYH